MGVLDALTILGSGISQGYRGSQELQRQLAEAKRKALLDEREQALREHAQASADALSQAQALNLGSEASARDFSTGEARAEAARAGAPIASGGVPTLHISGNTFTLPNRMDTVQNPYIAELLKQSSEERFKHDNPDFYMHFPPVGSNRMGIGGTNSPESRVLKLIDMAIGKPTPALLGEDEDSYTARQSQEKQQRLNFLLNNTATLDSLFRTLSGNTSSDTTTTGKGKAVAKPINRFKVKV